jgi:hypothetical protein
MVEDPPSKPTFTIADKNVSDVIDTIINNTIRVKCESKGNPRLNYSWIGPDLQRMIQILEVTISDTNNLVYTCTATNRMFRQNGSHEDGHNETAITIKVMCMYSCYAYYFFYKFI